MIVLGQMFGSLIVKGIGIGLGGIIIILLMVIIIRALMFKPLVEEKKQFEAITFDREKPIKTLQAMIQCKTVSFKDETLEDEKEYLLFEETIKNHFPLVHQRCQLHKLSKKSLLYLWPGKTSTKEPTVLMSHYDVVPVNAELWDEEPFSGLIKDGSLWGRGTLDTKNTLNGILNAAEHLMKNHFVPEKDVYFAFSGNEEIMGYGAVVIVDWFEKQGMKPSLVVDEGGAVVERVFPGVKKSCALVGIAEKGAVEIELVLKSSGGHASAPKPHTVVGELSQACVNVEKHPFQRNLSKPVAKMFDVLGRESSFLYRMIFSNLWLFGGLLDLMCKKSGGELNALMRTTMAFTQMQGSNANNVIPPYAKMGINSRLMCGETSDQAIAYVKKVIKNDAIEVNKIYATEPSRISEIECGAYEKVKEAIVATWDGVVVSPYLMFACSDSRHYGRISPYVYRFSAMRLSKEERQTIHGNNEKIPLESIVRTVEFYIRLISMC